LTAPNKPIAFPHAHLFSLICAREEFKNVIATSFPELLPLVTLFYNQPNTVHYKWNDGSWRCLLMEEGASQGCPLSPLFASFVIARLLKPIDGLICERAAARFANGDSGDDGQGGISHLLSFVNDISSCVCLPDFQFLCEQVRTRGASIGCFVNSHKTRVLTSCNGTSIFPALTAHDPQLALSISNSIASFSTTPHPTDKTAPDITVELTTGFRLLGQPVRSATFATEFFDHRIDNVKKILPHYSTTSLTNKPASTSSPNAPYKNYPISCMRAFYIIYQPTTLTHPGKNGVAHSPPTQTLSSKHSSPHSSPLRTLLRTYSNMPSSSVNWAYVLAVLVSYGHVHRLPQTLSLLWLPPAGMPSMVSKSTRTSLTSPSTKPLAHYLTSPPTTPPKFSNNFTASSPTLQKLPAPHPSLPQSFS